MKVEPARHGERGGGEHHRVHPLEQALGNDAGHVDGRGLQEAAAAALFHPVDEILVVLFHEEAQSLVQFLGAPEQRNDLLRRILQQPEVRADQFQRGQQVRVDLLVVLAEGIAAGEGHAPFHLAEETEEVHREFVQPLQDAVQLRRAELLHPADDAQVAPQVLEAVIADARRRNTGRPRPRFRGLRRTPRHDNRAGCRPRSSRPSAKGRRRRGGG